MRALGPFPLAGTDQDLAVLLALVAMKLVNRHGDRIIVCYETSSRDSSPVGLSFTDAFLKITRFRRRQPPPGVGARCWSGIGPVLVWCRPDVDTVLINRTGPQVSFLTTPCLPWFFTQMPLPSNSWPLPPGCSSPANDKLSPFVRTAMVAIPASPPTSGRATPG